MKRTPLKRTAFKRKPVKRPGVSPELRDKVLARDRVCFWRTWDLEHHIVPPHVCQGRLSFDHVKPFAMLSKRAPDSERDAVALCLESNIRGVPKHIREAQREYLAELYPTDG